jgi:NAD(P)-dependent dehydrogenase (short-subunit alcohol dehydrogenase family)
MYTNIPKEAFKDSVCLITGGAQGVGWAIAQTLANYGAIIYICDISRENLAKSTQKIKGSYLEKLIFLEECDVSNYVKIEKWIQTIYQKTQKIDILINNAVFARWLPIYEMKVEEIEKT